MKFRNTFALASVSLLALSMPGVALAQSAGSPAAEEEDSSADIIVSARRREEKLQDVPVVITAVTSDTVEKLNLREAKELVGLVPGLDFKSYGYASSMQLRGLTFDINAGTLSSVATYLNDAPINARALFSQLYDIGQVEVLHGPQGTLQGQAAPSGAVTFTTRKPDLTEFGAALNGTVTAAHGYNINGSVNLPVIKDMLGIRVAGVWDKNQSNRVRTIASSALANKADPFAKEKGGRVSVLFTPADWIKLEGVYQKIDYSTSFFNEYASSSLVVPGAAASAVLIRPGDRLSIQESQSVQKQTFDIFNWRGEFSAAGQKLIYQGSYVDGYTDIKSNQDGANFLQNRDIFQVTQTSSLSTTHEIRLQNEDRIAGMFDYVVGYFYSSGTAKIHLDIETPVLLPAAFGGGIATVAVTPIDSQGPNGQANPDPTKENSIFANLTAHVSDKFQISAGVRHLKLTEGARFLRIGANLIPNGAGTNEKNWIYTASAQYNFTPDAMVYVSTGTSHRRGPSIFQSALLQSALQRSFTNLASEDSKSYEIGLKSAWLDRKLIFNLSLYRQTFKNYPFKLASPVFFVDYDFINGGFVPKVGNSDQWGAAVPVGITGVEAELSYKPSRSFSISAVASYSDSKIKNGLIPCNDFNGDGVPDATVPTNPTAAQLVTAYGSKQIGSCSVSLRGSNQSPFSATFQAEYNHPLSDKMELFGRGLFSYYGASQNNQTLPFDSIGAYGLLNLYAGLRAPDGAWEVTLFAKNLANNASYTSFGNPASTSYQQLNTSFMASGASFTSAYSRVDTSAPREFGLNLKIAFGSR